MGRESDHAWTEPIYLSGDTDSKSHDSNGNEAGSLIGTDDVEETSSDGPVVGIHRAKTDGHSSVANLDHIPITNVFFVITTDVPELNNICVIVMNPNVAP